MFTRYDTLLWLKLHLVQGIIIRACFEVCSVHHRAFFQKYLYHALYHLTIDGTDDLVEYILCCYSLFVPEHRVFEKPTKLLHFEKRCLVRFLNNVVIFTLVILLMYILYIDRCKCIYIFFVSTCISVEYIFIDPRCPLYPPLMCLRPLKILSFVYSHGDISIW